MILDLRGPPMPYAHAKCFKKGLVILTRANVTLTDVMAGKQLMPTSIKGDEVVWQCGPCAVDPPGHTMLYRCDFKQPVHLPLHFALALHEREWLFIWIGEDENAPGLHVRLPKFKHRWKLEELDAVDEVAELEANRCSPEEANRRIAQAHEARKEMMRPKK